MGTSNSNELPDNIKEEPLGSLLVRVKTKWSNMMIK